MSRQHRKLAEKLKEKMKQLPKVQARHVCGEVYIYRTPRGIETSRKHNEGK